MEGDDPEEEVFGEGFFVAEEGVLVAEGGVLAAEETVHVAEEGALVAEERAFVAEETGRVAEEMTLVAEEGALVAEETARGMAERQRLAVGRQMLAAESGMLATEREMLVAEREMLATKREMLVAEREMLATERERLVAEREMLAAEETARVAEEEILVSEEEADVVSVSGTAGLSRGGAYAELPVSQKEQRRRSRTVPSLQAMRYFKHRAAVCSDSLLRHQMLSGGNKNDLDLPLANKTAMRRKNAAMSSATVERIGKGARKRSMRRANGKARPVWQQIRRADRQTKELFFREGTDFFSREYLLSRRTSSSLENNYFWQEATSYERLPPGPIQAAELLAVNPLPGLRCAKPPAKLKIELFSDQQRAKRNHYKIKGQADPVAVHGRGPCDPSREAGLWCMKYDPRAMSQWASVAIAAKYQEFLLYDQKRAVKNSRAEKREKMKAFLMERKRQSGNTRELYRMVAAIFAEGLLEEWRVLVDAGSTSCGKNDSSPRSLGGLFAKWAPTPAGRHDKATLVVDEIIRMILQTWPVLDLVKLFPSTLLRNLRKFFQGQTGGVAGEHDEGDLLLVHQLRLVFAEDDSSLDGDVVPILRKLARQVYHRDLLARLRGEAEIPEHFIGQNLFRSVNYQRMPSRCRQLFGLPVFRKHASEEYDQFLVQTTKAALQARLARQREKSVAAMENVKTKCRGKTTPASLKTGALLPHEVVRKVLNVPHHPLNTDLSDKIEDVVTEVEALLEWAGLVAELKGSMECNNLNFVPMADVSGSMRGTPMDVCVALSLLLAEAAPATSCFRGQVLTFSSQPEWLDFIRAGGDAAYYPGGRPCPEDASIRSDYDQETASRISADVENAISIEDCLGLLRSSVGNLGKRVEWLERAPWGGSTNVQGAFDLMLEKASLSTPADEREKFFDSVCLVIFSDMEFDCAVRGGGRGSAALDTAHETALRKFQQAGFSSLPKIVYWNLRDSCSVPIEDTSREGVALFSGFSAGLLGKFMRICRAEQGICGVEGISSSEAPKDSFGASEDAIRKEEFTPAELMLRCIGGDLYEL